MRLEPACQERLDEIAELASDVLNQDVSRASVVRAVMEEWLAKNEHADPAEYSELIRLAIVKRGRRPWKHLQQRIEVPDEGEEAMGEERIRVSRRSHD